ncbi:hypothetical protein JQ559_03540 [Bradyrhizobium viridifuturi]|nr:MULTISPECIES: hypothetical protein [Bradyrhizobium]ERF85936.1 MAG: phosphoribosyl-AMP cyclohydrolase [Bradyrhizobium sp. DFCI-1]PSO27197.1 hypothetical protein C7G43_09535 [Bradyrhizobium sp. MOS004]QRI67355.1 hypothetical protein JQ507_20465 [Bradyrhizobium sp. PSBB068]MBR1018944.1 hypothetical protein [Bradyrhizobium viridifuturi]MBR1034905.1 hypothetical protein [Bradyrhizobium viridifuturi]
MDAAGPHSDRRDAEQLGVALSPGVDEISLALVVDGWSRTCRSHAATFSATGGAVTSRSGLRIYPQTVATSWPAGRLLPAVGTTPAHALDQTLAGIEARDGSGTADLVAVQLEYPRGQAVR